MHEIVLNLIYMRVLCKSLYVLRVLFGHFKTEITSSGLFMNFPEKLSCRKTARTKNLNEKIMLGF